MESARLSAIPVFAALTEEERAAVAEVAYEVEAAAGERIAEQGDFGYALYAIESGTASVSIEGSAVRTLGPGDVFGEIAVLSSGRRTASVEAVTPLRMIALFKRDVWALERNVPSAAEHLRALIAERRDTTEASA